MNRLSLLAFLTISLLLPAFLRADETIEHSAVRAADEARIAAMRNPDRAALEAIFSDQLRYIHSNGVIDTKASFVELLASGESRYLAYEHLERDFTFPAPDIALMNGKAKLRVASEKGELDLKLSYLAVWRQEKGEWKFLAWQSCRLPDEEVKP